MKTEAVGMAYQCLRRAADIFPGEAAIWQNIGKCFHEIQEIEKADEFFRVALKCKPNFHNALEGLSMTHLDRGRFGEAIEYCNRSLAENPDSVESKTNRGMGYLALRRWREGWRDYAVNLGHEKNRRIIQYGEEVPWDGTKGLSVAVYGEQGIGDEISFASVIPDLVRDSKRVVIECDARLKGLFRRSFPTCEVHGTRYIKNPRPEWRDEANVDSSVAMAGLCNFYRNEDKDFPGEPYLVPDPEMALQWRALLKSLGDKPKIGLAWQGGLPHTGRKRRTITLDTLSPLFKYDADWVSLQYVDNDDIEKAEEKYGVKIHDWAWGNRFADYDQTVALISELDLVISVCTTVVHAAGGLGKECWCLVPAFPMWRYLAKGSEFPWAKSVSLYRAKGTEWPVHLLMGRLRDKFGDRFKHRYSESKAA